MEVKIIDTPRTYTVADIAPGKEFFFAEHRYLRTVEYAECNVNCVRLLDFKPCWISRVVPVEPCDHIEPVTCTFGELAQGDLFQDEDGIVCRYLCFSGCGVGNNWPTAIEVKTANFRWFKPNAIVTPLEQVEPLTLRART